MMFKIRILFFDFLVNIILRVYFIDLCGWVRWEFCSCFCEMWLRVCVMWMWWYWWLVEKWFNNVMEFYLFWDFILFIKKSVLFEIFICKFIFKLFWIRYMLFCYWDFFKDEKLFKMWILWFWKSFFDWFFCNGGLVMGKWYW